jgi:hypothetical protein
MRYENRKTYEKPEWYLCYGGYGGNICSGNGPSYTRCNTGYSHGGEFDYSLMHLSCCGL